MLTPEQESEFKKEVEKKAMELLRDMFKVPDGVPINPHSLIDNRPSGWSKRSKAPYYNERCAKWIKAILDILLKESLEGQFQDRVFFYHDFPTISESTLYLKIYQGKLYLLERMDPDRTYACLCDSLAFTKEENQGVRISWLRDAVMINEGLPANASATVLPRGVTENNTLVNHQELIDEFLESAKPGDKKLIERISLTPHQIDDIKSSLMELPDILFKITPSSISLIKLSQEEASKVNQ